jgi:hypothetical protein
MVRVMATGLFAAAAGCLALALGTVSACVTAPPPALPQLTTERPTILHEAVVPPTDQILSELPSEFIVPVELEDPDESFEWDVFVDYNPCAEPSNCLQPTPPTIFPRLVPPSPGTLDGGVTLVSFSSTYLTGLDPSLCHRIDFLVAQEFDPGLAYTWDSTGGDIVTWFFNPGGNPNGCPVYDAGKFQDGAFPSVDEGVDGLPLVPESGTDP